MTVWFMRLSCLSGICGVKMHKRFPGAGQQYRRISEEINNRPLSCTGYIENSQSLSVCRQADNRTAPDIVRKTPIEASVAQLLVP